MKRKRIVFFSGWAMAASVWDNLCLALPEYDCARSDWRSPPIVEDGAILAGMSLGGMRALEAVAASPTAPAALILIGSAARFTAAANHPGTPAVALEAMRRKLNRARAETLRDFFRACFSPARESPVEQAACVAADGFPAKQLLEGLDYLKRADLRAALPQVITPTLILHGTADAVIPASCGEYMAARLPNARIKTLSGHGHVLPLSAPVEIAAEMKRFLDETCH